jgi:pilus assembly protein CpaC
MIRKVIAPVFIIAVLGATIYAQVAPTPVTTLAANTSGSTDVSSAPTNVSLTVGRSTLVDVGTPILRVSLTSSDIADALVTSSTQLLLHGKLPGTISMFIWERGGNIRRYEIAVRRDLSRLDEQLAQLLPGEAVRAESNGTRIVLSGSVTTKDILDRAVSLASGYVDKKDDVVSLLRVQDAPRSSQVLLRVRFAEVSRSALTELGVNLFTSGTGVSNTLGRVTTGQFSAPGFDGLQWTNAGNDFGSPVTSAQGTNTFSDFLNLFLLSEKYNLGAMIKALQTRGLLQSLAEPNLVAESGKEASFLAGGEFPIPVAQGAGTNIAISIQFKEFGVRLSFLPIVSGDHVHLKVRPEVSMLDFNNAVQLNGFRIPALTTRRTETELELNNGQTFAIAGLMNNSMTSTLQKIPGIGDIPILGQLFRSKSAQKDQTELVVIITPQILPANSVGVTSDLPRMSEPFLPAIPQSKSVAPPRPAFPPSGMSTAVPAPRVEEKKRPEPEPMTDRSQRSTEPALPPVPVADSSKKATDIPPIADASGKVADTTPSADTDKKGPDTTPTPDADKKVPDAKPIGDTASAGGEK